MKIDDIGYIVFIKKYGEYSLLLKILSRNNGLITGYINKAKSYRMDYQIGNLVKFMWYAKNLTQLGNFKIELIKSYVSDIIQSKLYLAIIQNISGLISNLLYENYLPDNDNLFLTIKNIYNSINRNAPNNLIIKKYLYMENLLLNALGSGILLDERRIKKLHYISKRTGLAVSKEKGEPFADKLLLFPTIAKTTKLNKDDIIDCFNIIDFFLKRYLINDINDIRKYDTITMTRERLKKIVPLLF
ncbi:MAG: recombination protein O N-terminal domain-containing protein [Rickettsiales bacterium]|jgi:DNA repair protein RecO (recombination protein O)|nr:recombination protein O N-terminal domain-containing protein [Rickettsiales bacterium]